MLALFSSYYHLLNRLSTKKTGRAPIFLWCGHLFGHYDPQLYIFSFLYFNSEVAFFYSQQLTFN